MEIKYLKYLEENSIANPNDLDYPCPIEPISLSEIETLETTYNNGNPFPKALRELLYLAGTDCYVLDYGIHKSQDDLQKAEREYLKDYGRSITRPFYVIDCYNDYESFLFIYLDEGDNPEVYAAYLPNSMTDKPPTFWSLGKSLSDYINSLINKVKQGFNPF